MTSTSECDHVVLDVHTDEGVIKCRVCGAVVSRCAGKPEGSMTPSPERVGKTSGAEGSAYEPRPNWQTRATFDDMIAWATSVAAGEWTWVRNSQCKYVTLRIDTRAGAYRIEDRDGNEISLADLRRQFGQPDPTPSIAPESKNG